MAREKLIKAAYSAIAHLRREGQELTPSTVARLAGIGRSTLYRDDDDWNKLMAVIEEGQMPSAAVVELAPAMVRKPSRIEALADRVRVLEKNLEETGKLADETYQRLIDQLQYYFSLAYDTPDRRDESRKLRIEVTAAREEANRLKREIDRLNIAGGNSNVVGAKGHKRQIVIPAGFSTAKSVDHFLVSLHRLIPDGGVGKAFTSITFVCGLPLSGKSTWIEREVAPGPGTSLFIEGSLHTVEIRELMLRHVRRLCKAQVRCVWMLAEVQTCVRRIGASKAAEGASEHLIATIHAETERVTVSEEFDLMVGIRS